MAHARNADRLPLVAAALLVSAVFFVGVALLSAPLSGGVPVRSGTPGSVRAEWVASRPVWVVTDSNGSTRVVSALNPHGWFGLDELVGWCEPQGLFIGHYDGSRFDAQGNYVFGPAPHDLDGYRQSRGEDGTVRVGGLVPAAQRSVSAWRPRSAETMCSVDIVPAPPPAQSNSEPSAVYHSKFAPGHRIVDGAMIVSQGGGLFCEEVAHAGAPRCAGASFTVPQARLSSADEIVAVHHGSFAARVHGDSLSGVIALPGGYVTYHDPQTGQGSVDAGG